MAKVVSRRNRRNPEKGTNWLLIGGFAAIGIVGLFALLYVTLSTQGQPTPTPETVASLAEYCETNETNCVARGESDAPITVVEVSDYGCIHCRNFNLGGTAEELQTQYVDTGSVRWIVLPYALSATTAPAAASALCAAEQDQFFPYHHRLFELQDSPNALTEDAFLEAATDIGLDVDAFSSCLDDNRYDNTVQRNVLAAQDAGVSATPTFFINGAKVEGNLPLPAFQQEIESRLGS
jgi:protein-disulfide isomerase